MPAPCWPLFEPKIFGTRQHRRRHIDGDHEAVKITRFLSKYDFQDNPEEIKDFPREKNDFLIWPRDNGKIHDERNDFLKWPGSGDKFHDNKRIEGTNNHDEPSP